MHFPGLVLYKWIIHYNLSFFFFFSLSCIFFFYPLSLSLSYFFPSLRFLIDYCEPKFGPTDSLDWIREFERKRMRLDKAVHLLFCDQKFDERSELAEDNKDVELRIDNILAFVFFNKVQVQCIETVLSGLAFTLCTDEMEGGKGGGGGGGEERFSRAALLDTAVSSIGTCLRCFKGYNLTLDSHFHALLGAGTSSYKRTIEINNTSEKDKIELQGEAIGLRKGNSKVSSHENIQEGDNDLKPENNGEGGEDQVTTVTASPTLSRNWLDKELPLLARPLLDNLLLVLSLVHPSVVRQEEEVVHETLEAILQSQKARIMGYSAAGQRSLRSELVNEMGAASMTSMEDRRVHEERAYTGTQLHDQRYSYDEIPGAAGAAVRWLCIAHLLQLLIPEMAQSDIPCGAEEEMKIFQLSSDSVSTPIATLSSSVDLRAAKVCIIPDNNSNESILKEWSVSRLLSVLMDVVDIHLPLPLQRERRKGTAASTMRNGSIGIIITQWCAFLRSTVHILSICRPDILLTLCPRKLLPLTLKQSVNIIVIWIYVCKNTPSPSLSMAGRHR